MNVLNKNRLDTANSSLGCVFLNEEYRVQYLGGSPEDTKIVSFFSIIALEPPSEAQKNCGKGPSYMGEGRVVPPSTVPYPNRIKRRVLIAPLPKTVRPQDPAVSPFCCVLEPNILNLQLQGGQNRKKIESKCCLLFFL